MIIDLIPKGVRLMRAYRERYQEYWRQYKVYRRLYRKYRRLYWEYILSGKDLPRS